MCLCVLGFQLCMSCVLITLPNVYHHRRLAQHSFSAIQYAAKVQTRNLQDVELRCLSELVMNVELLEAERPTHMENEFEHAEMDGDGQLRVRNARFNTRVRPSRQVCSCHSLLCPTVHDGDDSDSRRLLWSWRRRTDRAS